MKSSASASKTIKKLLIFGQFFKDSIAPIAPVLALEVETAANATVGPGVVVEDGFREGGSRTVYEGWRNLNDAGGIDGIGSVHSGLKNSICSLFPILDFRPILSEAAIVPSRGLRQRQTAGSVPQDDSLDRSVFG